MAIVTCCVTQTVVFIVVCLLNTGVAENSIRLYGGPSEKQGLVQVNVEGQWKAICNEDWDALDALVTCKELGFTEGYAMPWRELDHYDYEFEFVPATEPPPPQYFPVEGNHFACNGSEQFLLSCRYTKHNTLCSTSAGVNCNTTATQFNQLAGRIAGYYGEFSIISTVLPGDSSGLVLWQQNYYYHTYDTYLSGGICDMNEQAAMMICDEQGYHNGGKAIQVPVIQNFPMIISELSCAGEGLLSSCFKEYTTDGVCPNGVLVNGVQCYTSLRPSVVGALAFAGVASFFILFAGAFGIHWIRRKAKVPSPTTINLTVGEQDNA